jgi:hypothetical protein
VQAYASNLFRFGIHERATVKTSDSRDAVLTPVGKYFSPQATVHQRTDKSRKRKHQAVHPAVAVLISFSQESGPTSSGSSEVTLVEIRDLYSAVRLVDLLARHDAPR